MWEFWMEKKKIARHLRKKLGGLGFCLPHDLGGGVRQRMREVVQVRGTPLAAGDTVWCRLLRANR